MLKGSALSPTALPLTIVQEKVIVAPLPIAEEQLVAGLDILRGGGERRGGEAAGGEECIRAGERGGLLSQSSAQDALYTPTIKSDKKSDVSPG